MLLALSFIIGKLEEFDRTVLEVLYNSNILELNLKEMQESLNDLEAKRALMLYWVRTKDFLFSLSNYRDRMLRPLLTFNFNHRKSLSFIELISSLLGLPSISPSSTLSVDTELG